MTLTRRPAELVREAENSGRPGLLGKHPTWVRLDLDDIAEVINGYAFSSMFFNRQSEGFPLIRIRDVGADSPSTFYSGPFDDRYLVHPGDVLVGMDGDFRASEWHGPIGLLNQRVCRIEIRDPERYDKRFLTILLQGYLDAIWSTTSSITVKHLSSRSVQEIPLPLPPLAEQRRIVNFLDVTLSRFDAGRTLLLAAKKRLGCMSATLLAALLEPGIREWREVSMGEICTSIRNGCFISRPGSTPNGVPILRIGAVRPLKLDLSDLRYSGLTSSELCRSDHLLEAGDILFTRYNGNPGYVGACAVVPSLGRILTYPDKLIRVKVDTTVADPEFVALACSSGRARVQISSLVKTTAGQAGIAGRDLKTVRVRLPELNDQRRIVTEYKERVFGVTQLNDNLVRLIGQSAKLYRSSLADAFTGQLVTQDPSDEPASVLLERIRMERELRPKGRRARRTPKEPNEQGSLL